MEQTQERLWTKDFASITLISFFMFFSFYVLLTTLPLYISDKMNASAEQAGLLVTSFLVAAIVIRPISGVWVNKYSNKGILVLSTALFTLLIPLYPLCPDVKTLLAVRVLHGLAFGVLTTIKGTVSAKLVPPARLGEGISLFSAAMGLAMVLGPYTGLILGKNALYSASFWICFASGILNIALALFMKVPAAHPAATAQGKAHPFGLSSIIERGGLPFAAAVFFMTFAYAGVASFLPLYAKELSLIDAAGYFLLCYAVCLMVCRLFIGFIMDRYGSAFVVFPCLVSFTVGLVLLSLVEGPVVMVLSGALVGIGYGSATPAFQARIVASAARDRLGTANAMFFNAMDSGLAIGSCLLGLLINVAGFRSIYMAGAAAVLIIGVLYAHWSIKTKTF